MRPTPARIASAAVVALVLLLVARSWQDGPADVAGPRTSRAGQGAAERKWPPEEVFRRAFWRQPAAEDRILRAERFEWLAEDGSLARWQWFIELKPGPELLGWLFDPETFGLIPGAPGSAIRVPAGRSGPPPDWFPSQAADSGVELRQSPAGGLAVLYRRSDNTLFATDSGEGFAAPVPR
jgi:hypothetical protein